MLDQSTITKNPFHHRRKSREEYHFILRVVENLTFFHEEFYFISFPELLCITGDSR